MESVYGDNVKYEGKSAKMWIWKQIVGREFRVTNSIDSELESYVK